jgi:hypothetical protein
MRGKDEVGFENKVCTVQREMITRRSEEEEEKARLDSLQHVAQIQLPSPNHLAFSSHHTSPLSFLFLIGLSTSTGMLQHVHQHESTRVREYLNIPGILDEESCCYFLPELGERIVPFYPKFVGIGKVCSVLLRDMAELKW